MGQKVYNLLDRSDISLLSKNCFLIFQKSFVYVNVCFAHGTLAFYDSAMELADDLESCLTTI